MVQMSIPNVTQSAPVVQPKPKRSKLSQLAPTDLTALTEALHQLNREVFIVFKLQRIAVLPIPTRPTLTLLTFESFVNNMYADRRIGPISVADEWRKWKGHKVVQDIVYEPGKPIFTAEGNYNEWRGSGLAPKAGPLTPWNKLLDHLFAEDSTHRDWFLAWLAYPFQYPGTKHHTACLFWSKGTGTGKSTIGYILKHLYGLHNYSLIRDSDLGGNFNPWAAGKQIAEVEELRGGSNAPKIADFMKSMITQHDIRVNEKHKAHYTVRDCINYYFTSNHSNALYLEEYDRRFFVHAIPNRPLPDDFFEGDLKPWLDSGGYEAILHFLMNLDLSKPIIGGRNRSIEPAPFRPGGFAPDTMAKKRMALESLDDAEAWAWELRNFPGNFPLADGHTIFTHAELRFLFTHYRPNHKFGTQQLSRRFNDKLCVLGDGHPVQIENGLRERLLAIEPKHENLTSAQLKAVRAQEIEESCAILTSPD